eukprot:COSAG02_NODE_3678_length_6391_cov_3.177845_8_plen_61_part_00
MILDCVLSHVLAGLTLASTHAHDPLPAPPPVRRSSAPWLALALLVAGAGAAAALVRDGWL